MIRIKSLSVGKTDLTKKHILSGEKGRLFWLDAFWCNEFEDRFFYLWLNDMLILQCKPEWIHPLNHYFYFLLEHPLFYGDRLTFQQSGYGGPTVDTLCHFMYHDLPEDVKTLPESYPFPFLPWVAPYPYIPQPPTPEPPQPPYPVLPEEPSWPDFPPEPPFDPVEPVEVEPPELEEVPDMKQYIPLTLAQKNRIIKTPYVTSSLRPSFFPSNSFGVRAQSSFNFTRSFSHLLAEGIFSTHPLRVSETGQVITTNVKDDYKVISHEHADTNYHDYFTDIPFTHLTLKTGAEAWTVKILTVYRWLSKYDLTDMDEMILAASTTSYFPFLAAGYSLKCPTASGGAHKTITGLLEF